MPGKTRSLLKKLNLYIPRYEFEKVTPEIPEFQSHYQELFNHMHNEHGLTLLESEMDEIIHIVNKMQKA